MATTEQTPQLFQSLGRIEGKMDMVLTAQRSLDERVTKVEAHVDAKLAAQDTRLDALEVTRQQGTGAVRALALVAKYAWAPVAAFIVYRFPQLKDLLTHG